MPEMKTPDVSFIIGGYSWKQKRFEIYTIRYSAQQDRFIPRLAGPHPGIGHVVFAGDVKQQAERAFFELIRERRFGEGRQRLDMEPFEVIRDLLRRSGLHDSIGGAPQLAKVNQYLNATTIAVQWPNQAQGIPYLQGRPIMDFEKVDRWILDPDTFWLSHQWLSGGGERPPEGKRSGKDLNPDGAAEDLEGDPADTA